MSVNVIHHESFQSTSTSGNTIVRTTFASSHLAAYPVRLAAFLLVRSSASTMMQCASVHRNNTVVTSVNSRVSNEILE
jgi:hypothetical protein